MKSFDQFRERLDATIEAGREQIKIASLIAIGSLALAQMTRDRSPDPSDPKVAAAYESVRQSELDVYGLAGELQREGATSRAAANAVDRLGQNLSGIRGELEDTLAENTDYFNQQ